MICDRKICTGCKACYNICPQSAIKMNTDDEGFWISEINEKLCINCGLCEKVCPATKKRLKESNVLKAYASINKNEDEIFQSSSGGIFSVLMEEFIKTGNYVCGCIFDEKLNVIHTITNEKEVAEKMKKSKYVQSDINNTFKTIKEKLLEGYKVLFSGTPCQVEGLTSYLGQEYDNLYTIDIICHGVPSPKMFKEHIKFMESKYGKLKTLDFRTKSHKDVNTQILSYQFEKKNKKIKNYTLDPYYNAFYNALNYRESCYNCKYANCNRMGDITLGDYWGVEKFHPMMSNKKGVSLILINSEKGINLFENIIKEKVFYEETKINNAKEKNNNLNRPVERKEIRDKLYKDMNKYGYKYVVKKYLTPKKYWIIKIKSMIPMGIKQRVLNLIKNIKKRT